MGRLEQTVEYEAIVEAHNEVNRARAAATALDSNQTAIGAALDNVREAQQTFHAAHAAGQLSPLDSGPTA